MNRENEHQKKNKSMFGNESRKAIEPDREKITHRENYPEEKKSFEVDKVRFQDRKRQSPRFTSRVMHSINLKGVQFSRSEPKNPNSTKNSPSERLIAEAIKGEYSYGKLGLILGLSSIVGGIILGLNGVAGSTSWTASLLGLESKINDAAPGVVLFIVGLFMVWATKPKVKMQDLRD